MNNEDFSNDILSKIYVKEIPKHYILLGLFIDDDGFEYEVDKETVLILLKDKEDLTLIDYANISEFFDSINVDQAEIDIVIDIETLKKEVEEATERLLEELRNS